MTKRSKRFSKKTSAPEETPIDAVAETTQPDAQDAATPDTPPTHKAVCSECGAHVTYALTSSGHGFMVLETSDADTTFGQGEGGQPLCPRGHGEMQLADEQIPVADAITQVVEQTSGNGHGTPAQRALFDTTKPFNADGALDAIETKNADVEQARERYESYKSATAAARKRWESEAKQLADLIVDLKRKRQARAVQTDGATADVAETAEDAAEVTITEQPAGESGDEAFTSEAPAVAAEATV